MLSKEKPKDFNKRFDIVGCLMQYDDTFLLLHRHSHKASGGTWGLPAGKKEAQENLEEALQREVQEETKVMLTSSSAPLFASWYARDGSFDFEWHMFSTTLDEKPEILISPYEHSEFRWVTLDEAFQMNLIFGLAECLESFYGKRSIITK